MHPATRRQLLGLAGLVAVALAGTLALSPARVLGALEALAGDPLAFAAVLSALYLVRWLVLWPVSLVSLVLGYLYDPVVAVPIALAGAGLTALPPFLLARHGVSRVGLFGALGAAGDETVAAVGGFRGALAARLAPIPGDLVSYAAGLSSVGTGTFLAGTVVGEVPWTLAAVAAGNSMATLSVDGLALGPMAVVGLVAVAVLVCWRPIARRLRNDAPGALRF